ncbi:MAG: S-methyl-5'-thioadenosine phosphorylase [Anaerolineaceae bacterium]|nr:S-methyl-5'-thioadenosine phosphorylase [Anaerolineaceae bacterium]
MNHLPTLAVIGGTGLTEFSGLTDIQQLDIETPFGKPSSPIFLGAFSGKKIAFLARHGIGHSILPGEINNQANIYALKSIGATRILAVSACGSLREDYAPGDIIIPDQLFDFTRGRQLTFFGGGLVAHVGAAEPFCPNLSQSAYEALHACNTSVHSGGTLITIEGPRFSTRAESNLFRAWGMAIIGMTTSPEAFLAKEAEICYTTLAHITDYDVWRTSEEPVNVEMVINTLRNNTAIIQQAIRALLEKLPEERNCACANSLEKAIVTDPDKIPAATYQKLSLLVDKYLTS